MLKRFIFLLSKEDAEYDDLVKDIKETVRYLEENGVRSDYCMLNQKDSTDIISKKIEELLDKEKKNDPDILDNSLFMTDSSEIAMVAERHHMNVLGILHKYNVDTKFEGLKFIFTDIAEIEFDSFLKSYQRLEGIPWDVLETKRCLVRETKLEDVDYFYEIYKDPEMTRYMEGLFENPEDEKRYTRDYIDKVYAFLGFGTWTIIEKESGDIIGRAGFSIRNGFENVELGFLIGVKYQNKGYAQEVCSAIMDYGKEILQFDKVQAMVKKENLVSIHILKKLGFKSVKEVDIEENIYGNSYHDGKQVDLTKAHYGKYVQMIWSK